MRLPIRWGRVGFVVGLNAVVHLYRDAAAQLEDTGAHHHVAGLDAGNDRHLITAGRTGFYKLLQRFLAGLAVRPLFIFHNKNGVAIGRITDRGCRDGNSVLLRLKYFNVDEHARTQPVFRVPHRALDHDIARRLVETGIDRRDLTFKLIAGDPVRFDAELFADSYLAEVFLWEREIHIDRIRRLERHNGCADIQVLAEVHLPDADHSIERGRNGLAGDVRSRIINGCSRLAKLAFGGIVIRLRDGSTSPEIALAVETQFCQVAARFRGMQLGLFL